jgi:hypothetical protein
MCIVGIFSVKLVQILPYYYSLQLLTKSPRRYTMYTIDFPCYYSVRQM